MKKKGFTLIELLAVIILLAILALIATPIVLDVVENAKKSAFESTAYGMIDAMKLKSAEDMIDGNSMTKEYTFPSAELDVQGDQLTGTGKVDEDGRIAIAVNNGKWCATKGFTDGLITVKEYVEGECALTEEGYVVVTGTAIKEYVKELVYDEEGHCDLTKAYEYMGGCYIKSILSSSTSEETTTSTATSEETTTSTATSEETTSTVTSSHITSTKLKNHVWYNGFLWRIMGINSDGSIRMITEENVTAIPYNVADNTNFDGSHADNWLNDYFYNKLSNENNLKDIIVEGTFCQGAATTTSSSRTDCTGETTLSRNVGLLSIDEYNLAGGSGSYLKNFQFFWTLSPYDSSNAWVVLSGSNYSNVSRANGLRPVINVNSSSTITGGNGTLSDFYVLGEYKNETSTIETLSSAKIGEYVSLNNKIYRVVENGITTKLILDGYYQETAGANYKMHYGSDNVFTTENRNTEPQRLVGIGYKLNNDILNWLTNGSDQAKLKSMIVTSNWYQNQFDEGNSYTVSLAINDNPITAQVGLIRVGEMLSGQSYSILTKNGTVVSDYINAASYWTMTPHTGRSSAWVVDKCGNDGINDGSEALRPVINVNSNYTISSGNGTIGSPYVIEIK